MARTPSNMVPLETPAPGFLLPDTTDFGAPVSWQDIKGSKGTLVVFMCNHCPFVIHVLPELLMVANDYRVQGLGIVAISSNDAVQYPQDGPAAMTEFAFHNKMDFPYLYDESQQTARDFDAACTPDFFLYDSEDKLCYRGQLDDSRPGNNIPLSGTDLRQAIDALLYNRSQASGQKPSLGCNIKWKKA